MNIDRQIREWARITESYMNELDGEISESSFTKDEDELEDLLKKWTSDDTFTVVFDDGSKKEIERMNPLIFAEEYNRSYEKKPKLKEIIVFGKTFSADVLNGLVELEFDKRHSDDDYWFNDEREEEAEEEIEDETEED